MQLRNIISVFLIAIWSISCSPVPTYFKKGDECYRQMDYDMAATYYYNILLLDSTNFQAKEALQKTGNLVLTAKFSRFGNLVAQNKNDEAIQQFLINKRYFEKVNKVQVQLHWPSMYESLFDDLINDFIFQSTENIIELIAQKKYDKAELLIEQMAQYERSFSNATITRQELFMQAYLQYAQHLVSQKKLFKAFQILNKSHSFLPATKISQQLLKELVNKLAQKMAVFPIEEQVKSGGFATTLIKNIESQIPNIQPELIHQITENHLKLILPDSIRQTNDPIPISKALLKSGIQLYLQIAVNQYKITQKNPSIPDSIIGYEAYEQQIQNEQTQIPVSVFRFKPVKYAFLKKINQVEARITYRLVDCSSQLPITENSIELTNADSMYSYFYAGDLRKLYQHLPVGNKLPERDPTFYEQFNLVDKKLIDLKQLEQELALKLAELCINDIQIYLKQD